jgi:hypothetical protein
MLAGSIPARRAFFQCDAFSAMDSDVKFEDNEIGTELPGAYLIPDWG